MNEVTATSSRLFPSTSAAAVVGAVVMPLFMGGWRLIEVTFRSQVLLFLWVVVAFLVPFVLATFDFKYAARRRREQRSGFRPMTSAEDFRQFYVPAWKRMFVWFVSTVVVTLLLKAVGILT